MSSLSIIGTAGRKEDAPKLSCKHWNRMVLAAEEIIAEHPEITRVVSGGAAWADHVALKVVERNPNLGLKLYLPGNDKDIGIMDYYHRAFSLRLKRDTWAEIIKAAKTHGQWGGTFKERNTLVANDADIYLAMTFGCGRMVKDGGTADTVAKMDLRGIPGYHFDLNSLELYERRTMA